MQPHSSPAFINQIESLSQEGLAVSLEYQKISEDYKTAIENNKLRPLEKATKKHHLIVDAFGLIDQQLQLVLKEHGFEHLKALSQAIENSQSANLIAQWNLFKEAIKDNQNINFELDLLIQKNIQNNQQMLSILQGFGSNDIMPSYNQNGQVSSASPSRSFGSI
jgi:flagellar biosynthesis/type III secretory pathway chaperone